MNVSDYIALDVAEQRKCMYVAEVPTQLVATEA